MISLEPHFEISVSVKCAHRELGKVLETQDSYIFTQALILMQHCCVSFEVLLMIQVILCHYASVY
jgi:hypothetical protein